MAIDQRDYYRDLIRKKTGYVERASFRIPANEENEENENFLPALQRKTPKKQRSLFPIFWIFIFGLIFFGIGFIFLKIVFRIFG